MSTASNRQIVITGVGVVSPIGIGRAEFWESLQAGRSGVSQFPLLQDTEMPVRFGASIQNFEPKQYIKPRKAIKVMSREIQAGFAAATLAMGDAELAQESLDPDRVGVVFGAEMLYCEVGDLEGVYRHCIEDGRFDFSKFGQSAMSDIFPLWMLKYLPNMTACHIGIAQDARGPNNTLALGEASGLIAVIEAARVIERGHADVMIAGGTGSRLSLTPMMYRGDSNLSHYSGDPQHASRPFDAQRDGMVNGEGAAAFVLESKEHADARGADLQLAIEGTAVRYESRLNGVPPSGDGFRLCIEAGLAEAGVHGKDVGHVNAHGLGTIAEDRCEAQAIRDCLGDVPVFAPKSYFGSLGAGGGAVELAASVVALQNRHVPATLNYETPDPECPVNVVHGEGQLQESPRAIALNQSGTGQTAALLLSRLG